MAGAEGGDNQAVTKQHHITPETAILDETTTGAPAATFLDVLGLKLDLVYEIPDSDRREMLLRFGDGPVLLISCDPSYDEDGIDRVPDKWETVVYDATDTEAGQRVRKLKPGQYL